MKGIFGDMCDLDRDGSLSPAEQALEMMILDDLTRDDNDSDSDDWGDE